MRYTYAPHEVHGPGPAARLQRYLQGKFPCLREVRFTHRWPGLIGVSKDLLGIAGPSEDRPGLHLALCAAGLPWSTLAGQLAARRALEGSTELDRFFAPERAFSPIERLQPLLRKPVTFALSHYYAKYHQRGAGAATAGQQGLVRLSLWLAGVTVVGGLLTYFLSRAFGRSHRARQLT